jgi:hypothetical protein
MRMEDIIEAKRIKEEKRKRGVHAEFAEKK